MVQPPIQGQAGICAIPTMTTAIGARARAIKPAPINAVSQRRIGGGDGCRRRYWLTAGYSQS